MADSPRFRTIVVAKPVRNPEGEPAMPEDIRDSLRDSSNPTTPEKSRPSQGRLSRQAQSSLLSNAREGLREGSSRRQLSAQLSIPRGTLRDWLRRPTPAEAPASLVAFFETPEGVVWLQRCVTAAHMVITQIGGAGVRLVCEFLNLSGLSCFVGSSYGAQQRFNVALEQALVDYGQGQRQALSRGMAPREINFCEDETFHPDICLVGLHPESNFIFLEEYAKDRSAMTWTLAVKAALQDLPVTIIQCTSDLAKGLIRHVRFDLGAHHTPDFFHFQHDVSKATSLHLARQVRQAETAVDQAQAAHEAECQAEQAYHVQTPKPRGRPPEFKQRRDQALWGVVGAELERDHAIARQQQARDCLHELSRVYHPYDLKTGQAQSVAEVGQQLEQTFQKLRQIIKEADLPERANQHLEKAWRVTTQLLASLHFFFAMLQIRVESLQLPPEVASALSQQLIPALYIERVAQRASLADQRKILRGLSAQLLAPLQQPDHPVMQLSIKDRLRLERVAGDCADLFQRSSSCVEGRNGQLSLYHHGRHRLSRRKLTAHTTVHNYFIRRPDGTTAAQRFFGRSPEPLMPYLLKYLPPPPRPARRRPRSPRSPLLLQVAA